MCCRLLLLRCYMKSVWNHRVLCVVFWEQVDVQLTSSVLQVEALRFYMRSVCNNWTLCVVFRLQDDVQLTSECKEGKSESNADKGVWSSAKAGRMIRCMKWSFCKLCQSLDFCVLTIVKNCNQFRFFHHVTDESLQKNQSQIQFKQGSLVSPTFMALSILLQISLITFTWILWLHLYGWLDGRKT